MYDGFFVTLKEINGEVLGDKYVCAMPRNVPTINIADMRVRPSVRLEYEGGREGGRSLC